MLASVSDTALIRGDGIERYGLKFYPITMEHYKEWRALKGVLTLRMSTLPALYASMPYLRALFAMDVDTMADTGEAVGFISRLFRLMCLSLRIPVPAAHAFKFKCAANDPKMLESVRFAVGVAQTEVTVAQFHTIRQTMAELNGETLPDESENVELVRAEHDMLNAVAIPMDDNLISLIASVARDNHVRMRDILDWTVLEFEEMRKAGDRDRNHQFGRAVESGMGKWPNGNPYPSWIFDKLRGTDALIDLESWKRRIGDAVQKVDSLPNSLPNKPN